MIFKDDLSNYKAFRGIVLDGSYEIKGEAVIKTAQLFQWFLNQEKAYEGKKPEQKSPGFRPIGPPKPLGNQAEKKKGKKK